MIFSTSFPELWGLTFTALGTRFRYYYRGHQLNSQRNQVVNQTQFVATLLLKVLNIEKVTVYDPTFRHSNLVPSSGKISKLLPPIHINIKDVVWRLGILIVPTPHLIAMSVVYYQKRVCILLIDDFMIGINMDSQQSPLMKEDTRLECRNVGS